MPTIVDSLIVTLGLDGRGFNRGRQQATGDLNAMKADARRTEDEIVKIKTNSTKATKAQDDIQIKSLRAVLDAKRRSIRDVQSAQKDELSATKNQSEAIRGVRDQLVGMLALFTAGAGLKSFIASTISGEAATGRLAANLGIATETLSTFEAMARRVGGTSAEGAASIQALVSAYQEFRLTGSTGHDQDFNALGISAQTLSDPVATLRAFAAAAERMSKPEFAARMSRIGILPAMINALELGRQGFAALYIEAVKAGQITEEDARAGQLLTDVMSDIGDAAHTVGRDITTAAAPALLELGRMVRQLTEWARNNEPVVAAAFYGLATAAVALAVALAAPLAPFIAMALAVGSVVAGFIYLVETYPQLASAFAELGSTAEPLATAIGELGSAIAEWFGDKNLNVIQHFLGFLIGQLHVLGDLVRVVTALLHGDLAGAFSAAKDVVSDEVHSFVGTQRASRVPAPGPGAAPAPGNASDEAYFRSRGFSPQAAAGIAAGIQAESGGDPNAVNQKSHAFGLGQWLGRRKQMLFERYGTAPTRAQQLEYIAWEMAHGDPKSRAAGTQIASSTNAKGALDIYINGFERPKAGPETTGDLRRGGAYLASAGAGVITTAQAAAGASSVINNGPVTTTTTINGGINIATAATDAKGIAGAIGPAIRQRGLAFQANSGLG